ncbi:MAG TPA: hypothetical protein VHF27_03270 [Acidimicrobiales bacterium]|nr:hypothetical protein [Acidimicrobiales bacterium]
MQRSKRRRTGVLMLAAVVAMGTAACGDDGDEESAPTTTEATVAPVQGAPLVTIDMVDHAFQVSGPLTAGGTLRISNRGSEFHMIAMGRFKPGQTLGDLQRVLAEAAAGPAGGGATTTSTTARATTTTTARGATTTTTARTGATTSTTGLAGEQEQDPTAEIIDEVGLPGGFMGPNESVEVTVPSLQPGTYALLCFVPTEGEGTPHFAKGMVAQLEVVAGAAPPPPTADATYRVAPGRAVEGPTTLTAGRHTIMFEAAPGSEQLEPSIARLNAGTTFARLNTALENLFEGDTPPARGAAGRIPGQVVFGGFDLRDVTTFYLTAELRAGNYVIVASDTDQATSGTPREIINVRVT